MRAARATLASRSRTPGASTSPDVRGATTASSGTTRWCTRSRPSSTNWASRPRQEVYWRLTAGAAARPQHRKLHRLGEKLWHQLRTGYGPLGYVFGSQGSPRPIPYGYKCPACGAEDMSLLHVLAWCSHTETAEEAAKLGLRFVLRDASKTVEQRAKAARWCTRREC